MKYFIRFTLCMNVSCLLGGNLSALWQVVNNLDTGYRVGGVDLNQSNNVNSRKTKIEQSIPINLKTEEVNFKGGAIKNLFPVCSRSRIEIPFK